MENFILDSYYESFHQAVQINDDEYEELDRLHYKVENELIRLIDSLKEKNPEDWEEVNVKCEKSSSQGLD